MKEVRDDNYVINVGDTSVKIVDDGLDFYFSLFILFYFILFSFSFSIFRTTRVRVYQSHCHISHKLMV